MKVPLLNEDLRSAVKSPGLLLINRTKPFDIAKFLGIGSVIWRGSRDGSGLKGKEEQDIRSLKMTELDVSKVFFTERPNEKRHVLLDAKVGQALLEERDQIKLKWLHWVRSVEGFKLPGTALCSPRGYRYYLGLHRNSDDWWTPFCHGLEGDEVVEYPSAVLED